MDVLKDWTRVVMAFTECAVLAGFNSHAGIPYEELDKLAARFVGGEFYHTGGGIWIAIVPIGNDHLAIASAEELSLWATGQGGTMERYEITYEQASGYEPKLALSMEGVR